MAKKRINRKKSSFSNFKLPQLAMIAVIFGALMVSALLVSRAGSLDGYGGGTLGNNCGSAVGGVVIEESGLKENFGVCQLDDGSTWTANTWQFTPIGARQTLGGFSALKQSLSAKDYTTIESCFYLRAINGAATVDIQPVGSATALQRSVTISDTDFEDYCYSSELADAQNAKVILKNGSIRVSSVILVGSDTSPPNTGPVYYQDFTDPDSYNEFNKITWHRDKYLGGYGFEGDHAPVAGGNDPDNCTNPFTRRAIGPRARKSILVESGEEHVYRCAPGDDPGKAHIMTAQGSESGYDFSAFWTKQSFENVSEVSWDQNITDLGGRNWSEVKIVPVRTWNPLQPPCGVTSVPCWTQAEGGTGGTVRTHADMGSLGLNWFNGVPLLVTQSAQYKNNKLFRADVSGSIYQQAEYQFNAFSSPAPRFRHTLRDNGDGTITAMFDTKLTDYGVHEIATIPGSFPDEPFVVVFSTHDYTSGKSPGAFDGKTWHWDNIEVK